MPLKDSTRITTYVPKDFYKMFEDFRFKYRFKYVKLNTSILDPDEVCDRVFKRIYGDVK